MTKIIGVTLVNTISGLPVYKSVICRVYIALCVHHPNVKFPSVSKYLKLSLSQIRQILNSSLRKSEEHSVLLVICANSSTLSPLLFKYN